MRKCPYLLGGDGKLETNDWSQICESLRVKSTKMKARDKGNLILYGGCPIMHFEDRPKRRASAQGHYVVQLMSR